MEVSGRSSTAFLLLLLLLLLLALSLIASSTTPAAAAATNSGYYKLITIYNSRGNQVRLAVRAGDSSIAGFANGKENWFAIRGSEQPFRNGRGFVNLLGALGKKNATS